MSKKIIAALMFSAVAVPMAAFATTPIGPRSGLTLTWDQLKDACVNPRSYSSQIPPQEINIVCTDTDVGWRTEVISQGTHHQELSVSITSDKYSVEAEVSGSVTNSTADCLRMIEERSTRSLAASNLRCEDILPFESGRAFCAQKLIGVPASVMPTGRMINTCALPVPTTSVPVGG